MFGTVTRTVYSTVPCSAPRAVPSTVIRTVFSTVTLTVAGGNVKPGFTHDVRVYLIVPLCGSFSEPMESFIYNMNNMADACYDRGSAFWLNFFLNGRGP